MIKEYAFIQWEQTILFISIRLGSHLKRKLKPYVTLYIKKDTEWINPTIEYYTAIKILAQQYQRDSINREMANCRIQCCLCYLSYLYLNKKALQIHLKTNILVTYLHSRQWQLLAGSTKGEGAETRLHCIPFLLCFDGLNICVCVWREKETGIQTDRHTHTNTHTHTHTQG
jgi:hypothetical protein